jgi:DNA-binding MarR family transcriptional regulator
MAERAAERAPAWLTDAEQRSWRALIGVTTGVLAVLDAELRAEHGLSLGEYEVLARLSDEPEHSLRMTDLAGRLRLSPSGITRRIDGLVRAGLVERRQCPSDRRGSNAVLTDAGMKRLREAAPAHVRGVRAHFIDQLSERELANLASALSNIDLDASRGAPVCDEEP